MNYKKECWSCLQTPLKKKKGGGEGCFYFFAALPPPPPPPPIHSDSKKSKHSTGSLSKQEEYSFWLRYFHFLQSLWKSAMVNNTNLNLDRDCHTVFQAPHMNNIRTLHAWPSCDCYKCHYRTVTVLPYNLHSASTTFPSALGSYPVAFNFTFSVAQVSSFKHHHKIAEPPTPTHKLWSYWLTDVHHLPQTQKQIA